MPESLFTDRAAREWAGEQLDRFTYRPGWTLAMEGRTAFAGMWEGRLEVSFRPADSRDPSRTTEVSANFQLPYYVLDNRDEGLFAEWLQRCLMEAERHESREWLRRDGVIYDDPHAGTSR